MFTEHLRCFHFSGPLFIPDPPAKMYFSSIWLGENPIQSDKTHLNITFLRKLSMTLWEETILWPHKMFCYYQSPHPRMLASSELRVCSCSVVPDSFVTPWPVARQAPLSMGFPRQEYWSVLQCPSPGHLSNPGIEPTSPELAGGFFTAEPPGEALYLAVLFFSLWVLPYSLWSCGLQHARLPCPSLSPRLCSNPYPLVYGVCLLEKIIALTIQTFVSKVFSLLFNRLFRFVIYFPLRSKYLLVSWL